MIAQETVIPVPAAQLARFRVARLRDGVDMIRQRAGEFRDQVSATVTDSNGQKGGGPSGKSLRTLSGAFAAAYLALSEALAAARSGSVVRGPALDALDGIMSSLKSQYANGLAGLREDVTRLDRERGEFAQFCAEAAGKIDKLEQFWETTYEHVPRMKMRA